MHRRDGSRLFSRLVRCALKDNRRRRSDRISKRIPTGDWDLYLLRFHWLRRQLFVHSGPFAYRVTVLVKEVSYIMRSSVYPKAQRNMVNPVRSSFSIDGANLEKAVSEHQVTQYINILKRKYLGEVSMITVQIFRDQPSRFTQPCNHRCVLGSGSSTTLLSPTKHHRIKRATISHPQCTCLIEEV